MEDFLNTQTAATKNSNLGTTDFENSMNPNSNPILLQCLTEFKSHKIHESTCKY